MNQIRINNNINKKDKILLLILLYLPCLLIQKSLDNDTWFLLNSGRYVINYGIPYIEPFSIHKNLEFVMQQWLTDVIFWIVYDNFAEAGLFTLVSLCYAAIIFLMYKLTMKVSENNFFVSFVITSLTSVLIFVYMVTRPTIFTLVIILIELNTLESFSMKKNFKYLFILPVLSLLMINLHAALWPMLFIMILPYIIDSFKLNIGLIKGNAYGTKYLIYTIVAMIIFAFFNPYGIKSMTYLIRSMGYPYMKNISEIMHPYVNKFTGAIVFTNLLLIILSYVVYRNGKTKVRYILLTLGTTYMVLTSIRNLTYFAIGSYFPLGYYLKNLQIREKNTVSLKIKILRYILMFIIVAGIMFLNYNDYSNNSTYNKYKELNDVIDYIINNESQENIVLYTGFHEGSLTQYRGLPSYIDPRAEVYFKKHNNVYDIFNEYFDMQYGKLYYKTFLDKYKFTHIIVTKIDLLYKYLEEDNDYILIYENANYRLYKINIM